MLILDGTPYLVMRHPIYIGTPSKFTLGSTWKDSKKMATSYLRTNVTEPHMFFIDQATYEGMRLEGFPVGDIYCLGGNTGILTQEIKLYQNVGLEFDIRYTGHIPLGYLHSMETEVCLIFELAH